MKKSIFGWLKTTLTQKKIKIFRTGFTLVEILVALIILSILAALSIATFQKTVEANKDRMCQQNLKVLEAAIEVYTLENNSLPDTLAKLKPRYIHLAYLKAVGEPKDNKLLTFLKDILGIKSVLAQTSLPPRYYGNNKAVLRCPADATLSSNPNYTSYTLNSGIFTDVLSLSNKNVYALIYDKQAWHQQKGITTTITYANGITPDGVAGKIDSTEKVEKVAKKDLDQDDELEDSECDTECRKELEKITTKQYTTGSN